MLLICIIIITRLYSDNYHIQVIDVRSYAKVPGTLTQPSINPYSQESTTGSLHQCTIHPTHHWCRTQPFIGESFKLFIGGESSLIGSIFDVYNCRLLQKIGKI